MTRYLFQSDDYSKQANAPKQRAFLPMLYRGEWETSIGRLAYAPIARIAHLARTIRHPQQALGRAVFPASAAREAALLVVAAPSMCYMEHAVLKGWSNEQDAKARNKAIAAMLVRASKLEVPIQESPPDR